MTDDDLEAAWIRAGEAGERPKTMYEAFDDLDAAFADLGRTVVRQCRQDARDAWGMRNAIVRTIRRVLRIPSPSRAALGMEPDATWAREAREREERRTGRGLRMTAGGWRWVDLPADKAGEVTR